jgi:hypothetical protein
VNLENENLNAPDIFGSPKPKPPLSLKAGTAACLVFLVVGLLAGSAIGRKLGPYRTITKTVTLPQPKPTTKTVKVKEIPENCKKTFEYMERLLEPYDKYVAVSQQQRDIVSDAYVAIMSRDFPKLTEIQDRQNKLNSNLAEARGDMNDLRISFDVYLEMCNADLGR